MTRGGNMSDDPSKNNQFIPEAQLPQPSLVRELWDFVKHNKKWWLLPIVLMLLVMGLLVLIGGSGLAPFIYTIF
jgi:hypothetical protein